LAGKKMHEEIEKLAAKCISNFEINNSVSNMWLKPIMTCLSANHPKLPEIKKLVSEDHFLPRDLLPDAKSLIIIFIPFSDEVIKSNIEGETASELWARAYILTNELLSAINDEIEGFLLTKNITVYKIKPTHNFFNMETLMSRWSHRHLAWLAGLGTFGLNNMLITERGCCGRFGSLITNSDLCIHEISNSLPAKERCLNKINGSCGICLDHCKFGALSKGKFDRFTCYKMCLKNADVHKSLGLADVCGKCLVGLPCSSKDPSK